MKRYFVYILSSKRNGTLYIGSTTSLIKRIWEHKNNILKGFTEKYRVHHLVYYEEHPTIFSAGQREKQLKQWRRKWKLELIQKINPYWRDLYEEICRDLI